MGAYKVMTWSSFSKQARGEVSKYVVTNQPAGWDSHERAWPAVAEFPVAAGFSMADQSRRAYEYCDYMNKTTPVQPPIGSTP